MFPCRPYFGVHIDGSPVYTGNCELMVCLYLIHFMNTIAFQKSGFFNFPVRIFGAHFHIFCVGAHVHHCFHELPLIFRWYCMPECHVDSFFHLMTNYPSGFDLLITKFFWQAVMFFKYIGVLYKIITFINPTTSGC